MGAPEENESGKPGSIHKEIGKGEEIGPLADEIAGRATLLYLETALRAAEVSYANEDRDGALDQLEWLATLLFGSRAVMSARESSADSGLTTEPAESASELDAVRRRVFSLIRRIALGLDFWGNTRNFVPILTHKFYFDMVDDLLEFARTIEEAHIRYRDAAANWDEARAALRDGLRAQEQFVSTAEQRLQDLGEVEHALVRDIEALSQAYGDAWRRVIDAGDAFKAAVSRKAGCAFKDVVKAVAAIGTAVATAGAGAGAAMAAWKAFDKFDKAKHDPKDTLGDLAEPKYKIEKIVEVGKGVAAIAKGAADIRDVLDRPNAKAPDLPTDAAKLLISRDDLAQTVAQFKTLPEATAYLDAVDALIELVTTRNDKILEYNALANGRADAEADIEKSETEMARLRERLARGNVAHLPEFASFMARADMNNKRALITMLYQAHRALEYYAGARYPLALRRDSIDHLAVTHQNAKLRLAAAKEGRRRERQTFTFDDAQGKFSLLELVGEDGLAAFKARKEIVFSLPDARFAPFALVRVNSVRVSLPGVSMRGRERGTESFIMELLHYGSARMQTVDRKLIEFSHEPRKTVMFYRAGGEATRAFELGGSETFLTLTPSGPWRLSIHESERERVSLDEVRDIVIELEGDFLPLR